MVFLFLDIQRYNKTIRLYHPHTYHSKPYLILHRSRTEKKQPVRRAIVKQVIIRTMNNLKELLVKPVWQMTGEEFLFLSRHASVQAEAQPQPTTDTERKYVYGILGIAKLFGCSLPTANRIKKSGKIDKAITQIGRKIIVDAELALELAGKKTGGRR